MTLTAPADGTSYTAPASIALAASASDPEGKLAKVEFYRGSTLLGTDTTSPFSYTWSSVAAGTYSLTAVAYDTAGLKTTSSAATVTVGTATNKPPTVTLTAPSSGANFTAPASISFAATASDPEGKLAKVEFYRGSTLLGTDTSSPFSYTWSSVAAGSYSLTAVAYDTAGLKATSAAVPITVGTVSSPPRYVVFQKSADHDTLVTSYRLNVYASGANPATATPIVSDNLGKPTPDASGNIQVDELSFFTGAGGGQLRRHGQRRGQRRQHAERRHHVHQVARRYAGCGMRNPENRTSGSRKPHSASRPYTSLTRAAFRYSRYIRAMLLMEIPLGHTASHSASFEQLPNPSAS